MKKELLYLVATSGDMSNTGMGDTTHVISFEADLLPQVAKFLKAQLDLDLALAMYYPVQGSKSVSTRTVTQKHKNFSKMWHALVDLGVFEHKYEARTTWRLEQEAELLKDLGKIQVRPTIRKEVA
jgi:hypothetical protein